ncbi:hypothetical protein [Pseudoclavibacter helvolus]|uniref:hypothetical protein n=1 Tax=Pseudoclavibacter helvolus TaxID=255205 RepID=UPI0035ED298E
MKKSEVAFLLEFANSAERRRMTPEQFKETIAAWTVVIGHLPLDAAMDAARRHYESNDYLTPAAVVAGVQDTNPHLRNVTTERLVAERDSWLQARGIDPAAVDSLLQQGATPRQALEHLGVPTRELESRQEHP